MNLREIEVTQHLMIPAMISTGLIAYRHLPFVTAMISLFSYISLNYFVHYAIGLKTITQIFPDPIRKMLFPSTNMQLSVCNLKIRHKKISAKIN